MSGGGQPRFASRSPAPRTCDRASRISHHHVPIIVTRVGQGIFRSQSQSLTSGNMGLLLSPVG